MCIFFRIRDNSKIRKNHMITLWNCYLREKVAKFKHFFSRKADMKLFATYTTSQNTLKLVWTESNCTMKLIAIWNELNILKFLHIKFIYFFCFLLMWNEILCSLSILLQVWLWFQHPSKNPFLLLVHVMPRPTHFGFRKR